MTSLARRILFIATALILPIIVYAQRDGVKESSTSIESLSGGDWKLGSFKTGEGELSKAFLPSFDDEAFRQVRVPGEIQLQSNPKGMERYYQTKELSLANEGEWWYRKHFKIPDSAQGRVVSLAFHGVDYFTTIWINGEKVGEHEGAYAPFSFAVTPYVHFGEDNVLVVKVTCPWLPSGRAFTEYMKGNFDFVPAGEDNVPQLPYALGPKWDGLPAFGNAVFPMGIIKNVDLVVSDSTVVEDLFVETKAIREDGSASLTIKGTVRNFSERAENVKVGFDLIPANFPGESEHLGEVELSLHPGDNAVSLNAEVKNVRLWWTWDLGPQNLYRLSARLGKRSGKAETVATTVFGIRTISRSDDLTYRLNGHRLFLKGAWYAMADIYNSLATRELYDSELRLFRSANGNLLVNFTVVENPEFYELCDQLGIMVFFEFPFGQMGPLRALDPAGPRYASLYKTALPQIRDILTLLRIHPSVVQWSAFAEIHANGHWGVDWKEVNVSQNGYGDVSDAIAKIVGDLDPGTIYHPSLCDLGEKHFWTASNNNAESGSYQDLFETQAAFISEYGAIALPSYETLKKILPADELWSKQNQSPSSWFNLPIDVSSYAYLTSYEYAGLFGMLHRMNQFVDRDIRSPQELVDDSQQYQAFIYKYATEAYRRKKYNPINGVRVWDYNESSPGVRYNFVDYYSVPKMAYYVYQHAQDRLAISFAYKSALESQVSGKTLRIPVWIVNDYERAAGGRVVCEISDTAGRKVWTNSFRIEVGQDASKQIGVVEWSTPEEHGVYVLRGTAYDQKGNIVAENSTFIKVTPRAFKKKMRVLLIGTRSANQMADAILTSVGVDVDSIDESSLFRLSVLQDADALHRNYDVVWLSSFDKLWKVMSEPMADGLTRAIAEGVGFVHTGGEGSYHGGSGNAACLEFTKLADALPVTIESRNDLTYPSVESGQTTSFESLRFHSIEAQIAAAGWDVGHIAHIGVAAFNNVGVRPGATLVMSISGRPLLVTGTYSKGKTAAFTGFTTNGPAEGEYLDQSLIQTPYTGALFELFVRMLASVTGESLSVRVEELLQYREKPLFQILKELPQAEVKVQQEVDAQRAGLTANATIPIVNGSRYARLVRVRAEWDDTKLAPYLSTYSDNYFDLLPGERRVVSVDLRFSSETQGPTRGRLILEGSNVPAEVIQLSVN